MALKLFYITNDPRLADIADRTGVDRVWVDLEKNGKELRQQGMNTVKSNHELSDIKLVKPYCRKAELLVRVNPVFAGSQEEIDRAIEYGADVLMLPYYKTVQQAQAFLDMVNGRVKTVLLLETKEAVEILDAVLELPGVDEIHIGLNDLHLSYGLTFMFELLCNGCVEEIAQKISKKGIPFGIGGIAKLGEGLLLAEYIVAEHYRLHSQAAILSRSFYDTVDENDYTAIESFFADSLQELRAYEKTLQGKNHVFFEENRKKIAEIVDRIVADRKGNRHGTEL